MSKILTRDGFVHLNLTCMSFHILHNVGGLVFLVLVAEHLLQGLGTSHHHTITTTLKSTWIALSLSLSLSYLSIEFRCWWSGCCTVAEVGDLWICALKFACSTLLEDPVLSIQWRWKYLGSLGGFSLVLWLCRKWKKATVFLHSLHHHKKPALL